MFFYKIKQWLRSEKELSAEDLDQKLDDQPSIEYSMVGLHDCTAGMSFFISPQSDLVSEAQWEVRV